MACMCHQGVQWSCCSWLELNCYQHLGQRGNTDTVKEAELGANEEQGQRVLKH